MMKITQLTDAVLRLCCPKMIYSSSTKRKVSCISDFEYNFALDEKNPSGY